MYHLSTLAHGIKCENFVWEATLNAFLSAAEATDFKEYKYVKTLMRQLRLTIAHLIEIADLEHEQDDVKNVMLTHADTIVTVLHEEISQLNMELKETTHIYLLCAKLFEWLQTRSKTMPLEDSGSSAQQRLDKMLKLREQEQRAFA